MICIDCGHFQWLCIVSNGQLLDITAYFACFKIIFRYAFAPASSILSRLVSTVLPTKIVARTLSPATGNRCRPFTFSLIDRADSAVLSSVVSICYDSSLTLYSLLNPIDCRKIGVPYSNQQLQNYCRRREKQFCCIDPPQHQLSLHAQSQTDYVYYRRTGSGRLLQFRCAVQ